jgi:hypothetical protein
MAEYMPKHAALHPHRVNVGVWKFPLVSEMWNVWNFTGFPPKHLHIYIYTYIYKFVIIIW